MVLQGSCLCGAVAYEVEGEPIRSNHCHCKRCRKSRGTGHATNAAFPIAGFRWRRGEERVNRFKVPDARYFTHAFCTTCGSTMPVCDTERKIAIIPLGSLDNEPGIEVERHIFVASKAAWDHIHDPLPKFDAAQL